MKSLPIFFVLLSWILPALSYADAAQERRLTISASIFPKILALDIDLAGKTDGSGEILLGIIYLEEKDRAENIANLIRKKVATLAGVKTSPVAIPLSQVLQSSNQKYAGYLLTEILDSENLNEIISHSSMNHNLLFSPFEGDIERGVASSIFVGAKIRPYFNLRALSQAKINLKPAILRVSKTYE